MTLLWIWEFSPMPILSGLYVPRIGPVIKVGIAGRNDNAETKESFRISALLDSGATGTCISKEAADRARIQPIAMREVRSVNETVLRNVYLIRLDLLLGGEHKLMITELQVLEFTPSENCPYQALIGRNVLCRGVFIMTPDGRFIFSM